MTDREVQFKVRIPEHLKARVDADSRTNKAVIETLLRREYDGESLAAKEAALRQEIDQLESQVTPIADNLAEKREELAAVKRHADAEADRRQSYEDALDAVLDDMKADGMRVFPGHARIEGLADEYDRGAAGVLDDLRERAEGRGLGLGPEWFRAGTNVTSVRPTASADGGTPDPEGGDGE